VKSSFFVGFGLLLIIASRTEAQPVLDSTQHRKMVRSPDSSEDQVARHILDDPGLPNLDPGETFEYLDGLPAVAAVGLTLLHANPEVTWTEAHAAIRAHRAISSKVAVPPAKFSLRSRETEPLEAESEQGYTTGAYLGPPIGFLNQIRASSPALEVAGEEEKQSWEPSFTEHLGGFVMTRSSIAISNSFGIVQAIAGDYRLAFGNGILFGGGVGRSEARAAAGAVEQRSFGMRGSLFNSSKSLRGGAAEINAGPGRLFVFASDRAVDASVVNDTIRTIYSSGIHRTQSELALANAATIRVIGARAEIATADTASFYLKGGTTAYTLQYDHPFAGTSNVPFLGTHLGMAGIDALAIGATWSASAEAAFSVNDTVHRSALLLTSVFAPAANFSFSLLYRHLPEGFNSPFGEVSGVGASGISNLDGYYFGIELEPIENRLRLNGYVKMEDEIVPKGDLFGKQKHDYLAAVNFYASKGFDLSATVRDEQNATVQSDSSRTGYATVQGETMHTRLEASYRSDGGAVFRTRFEQVRYLLTNVEHGWSASEEVRVPAPALRTELTISTVRFQTVSSNSAMWLYESGTPGTAAINALDGLGWRLALRASVHALRSLECSLYLAGTIYDEPHTFGSGLTAHTGTSDFTAAVQIDVRL